MRYLSHSDDDIKKILSVIGKDSIDGLFETIPKDLIFKKEMNLPTALNEWELEDYINNLAKDDAKPSSFLGGGIYKHFIPNIVPYLASRSEFLTAYTPYQPEISQGTLQALFEYQTYITKYLEMDYSNASMYDGATSFVEGILLSLRYTKRDKVVVSKAINPNYREVLDTYSKAIGFQVITIGYGKDGKTDLSQLPDLSDIASVSIQSPNYFGVIEDMGTAREKISDKKALLISIFSEALAFGLIKPPGSFGADIVCGEGQSLGIEMSFGGPCLGIFTFKEKLLRMAPGRIAGETVDSDGNRAFCLTLATREQHIRREKATSNICSNQGLCCLKAIIYMSLLGGEGLRGIAQMNFNNSSYLKEKLIEAGCELPFSGATFNEFVVKFPVKTNLDEISRNKILPGIPLDKNFPELAGYYLVTVTELTKKQDIDDFVKIIGGGYEL